MRDSRTPVPPVTGKVVVVAFAEVAALSGRPEGTSALVVRIYVKSPVWIVDNEELHADGTASRELWRQTESGGTARPNNPTQQQGIRPSDWQLVTGQGAP